MVFPTPAVVKSADFQRIERILFAMAPKWSDSAVFPTEPLKIIVSFYY
jgi:hypothetical protein